MSCGQFSGQSVPVAAGPGVEAHEAGLFLLASGKRDGHPLLGEEQLLTWASQVEGNTKGKG